MNGRFWRQRNKQDERGQLTQAVPPELLARFDALDQAMQAQLALMDERTRIMARALTAELQGLRIGLN